jgi:hypothetical protein
MAEGGAHALFKGRTCREELCLALDEEEDALANRLALPQDTVADIVYSVA